jgi:hypothetical protein
MPATNQLEDDLLDLLFTNVQAPNWGDASGLQPAGTVGSVYISLHDATLADTHTDQTQDEAAYGSYARQAVARSVAQWTVSAGVVDNDNEILFPEATSGSETETDFGLGSATSGAGYLQLYGALSGSLVVSSGVQPRFKAGTFDISVT